MKFTLLISLITLLPSWLAMPSHTTAEKHTLIYVFDPMCGWCYGFSHVLKEFRAKHTDKFDYEIISGGMVTGNREGWIGDDLAKYIESAYQRVEQASGCKYGDAYIEKLKSRKLWMSSIKPSMALEAFKRFNYDAAIDFAGDVQRAYFYEGKDLRDDVVYEAIIAKYNINREKFMSVLNEQRTKDATEVGFQTATNYGVKGYPTMLLRHKGKYYKVMDGFVDLTTLEQNIGKVVKF